MIETAMGPHITLPQLAQFAQGDLLIPDVPRAPTAREALLRSGVTGASIDTRTLRPGDLFVPLAGSRADGHAFLGEAFAKGAAAALCERKSYEAWRGREPGPLVLVENATLGLILIAHRYRTDWPGFLVCVTGSTGKTTTKELVAAAFATAGPTLKTEGNLNNHWGVPLTLMRLRPEHRVAVVEIAMNAPGEIEELARIAAPGGGVITNAGSAHLERFGTVEAIAREKAALGHALAPGDIVFAGADSKSLLAALEGVRCRRVTYGVAADADVHPRALEDLGPDGTRFEVEGFPPVHLRLVGRHQVANALAAIAVAREYGLDRPAVAAAISAHRPLPGRMEVRALAGATLIVDCYNANPEATAAALETLAAWPGVERRIAILGDMLELGAGAAALHRETGARVRNAELWAVGAFAEAYAEGARARGTDVRVFADTVSARAALEDALGTGVVVLLKASRGAKLERVIEGIAGGAA